MGSPLQEVLQRGGAKERAVRRLILILPYVLLSLLLYLLSTGFPLKYPEIFTVLILLFILAVLVGYFSTQDKTVFAFNSSSDTH